MFNILKTIFSIPDLRKKILFTLAMLVVFRIGAHITVPGVNFQALEAYFASQGGGGGFESLINMFSGGAFLRISVFALGIMPYISASIIMQLLNVVIPSLQALQKEGEQGRKKINQYTRYGTVIICALQAYGITVYIQSLNGQANYAIIGQDYGWGFSAITILTITTGTIILMWMGELMTEKGIGNGISILIFAGIIAGAPGAIRNFGIAIEKDKIEVILVLILLVLFVIMIGLSVILTEGTRKIPLQYGKKVVGRRIMQGSSQSLPIKVNAANVMPIIFASSLMLFPTQIASYLEGNYQEFAAMLNAYLAPGTVSYLIIYVILIIFFAYFYTAIQYNPKDIAEQLKKNGGYVPGIRPGAQTEEFIEKILNRITLSGAIFLAFIAIAPDLILGLYEELNQFRELAYMFGGTSLLIIVGVALDTLKQVESQLIMRHYDGFMDKSKKPMKKARMVR